MQNTNFYASRSVLSGHMKQTYGICLLQEVFWWIRGITEISFCRFPRVDIYFRDQSHRCSSLCLIGTPNSSNVTIDTAVSHVICTCSLILSKKKKSPCLASSFPLITFRLEKKCYFRSIP